MILDKFLQIKISKKNINHYVIFFPNIKIKDIITIDIEKHLQKNSNIKVNAECDICQTNRSIKYQSYTKNINSCPDHPIYTCDRCSHIKIKSFNKKKYGVEYFSQTKEYNEKFKSTMMERYGVEYALQNKELKEKAKKTNLNKFGVENPFQSKEIKKKIKKSVFEKYGISHIQSVPEIKDKVRQTNLEKYGFEYLLQNTDIKNRAKSTTLKKHGVYPYTKGNIYKDNIKQLNLEKYGFDWALQSPTIRNKINKTNLKKYGVDNPMKSEIIRKDMSISNDSSYIKYIGESISLFKCSTGHEFGIHIDLYSSRKRNNTPLCTICHPIGNSRSIKEIDLYNFIFEIYKGEIIQSYRHKLEIDIYLPDLKLGFEFNGLYYHSRKFKEKNFHIEKTNYFKNRGIRVIHIWEDDWDFKKEIIKSQIRNWIGISKNKIYARNCVVKIISPNVCKEFLNTNHIQGFVPSTLKLGLYNSNDLVSVMTFDHNEGRKKMLDNEWNLSRFCNLLNANVIGGASKLFSYFIKNNDVKRIISYADKDWSVGELYYKLGFHLSGEIRPDYKYLIDNIRIHKSNFRKSNLNLSENTTESEFMKLNCVEKIYDCGKIKFEMKII